MLQMRILKLILFVILAILSVHDGATKRLPRFWLMLALLAGAAGFLLRMGDGEAPFGWAGFLPGVFLLLMTLLTRGQIGRGDGMVLLSIGGMTGLGPCMLSLSLALLSAAFAAGCLMAFRGSSKKARLPFVPFLTVGYLAGIMA